MGTLHDNLATVCGDDILSRIRSGDPNIKQIFSSQIVRSADWDWPRPDYVCIDETLKSSYALEFKPPLQTKREYLTGLGQSLSYLQKHMYSGLIVPTVADDGYHIADFILQTLEASEFCNIAISLYSYNPSDVYAGVTLLKGIDKIRDTSVIKPISTDKTETFWCWWRDASQYEVYDLLELAFIYNEQEGDIYTEKIYPEFYERLVSKRTKGWDGKPRDKKRTKESYISEKQNYKIPLTQLELWNEGHLTNLGFRMLEIGKKYGPNSEAFMNSLGYLILVNGKHLELIKLFEKYQASTDDIPANAKRFAAYVGEYLTEQGCIGARKPSAVRTGAKEYIRDEPKIWNKFGILKMATKRSYFFKEKGYKFNWHKISDLLISGSQLLYEEKAL